MNCKCKECKHYTIKTDITGDCSLKHFTTFANATCEKSEKQDTKDPLEFLTNMFGFNKEKK